MCLIEGCTKKHEAQGYCKVHYNSLVRQGKLETSKGRGRPRIYTEEQRKQREREKSERKYYEKVGYEKGERPRKNQKNQHPSYDMWTNAKQRARLADLPFDLELEDIVIPEVCPVFGSQIEKGRGTYTDNSPTLDRIIPAKGYTKKNTWVISMRANRLKQDASLEEIGMIYLALEQKLKILAGEENYFLNKINKLQNNT